MKRKQRLAMLLIGCMCASILLSGCNNDLSDKLNNKYESSESPPETQYTITFDANGGTCMVTELTVNQNTTIGNLPTPERENHTFNGWYDAPENGNIVTNATIVNNSKRTTARRHALHGHIRCQRRNLQHKQPPNRKKLRYRIYPRPNPR